MRIGGRTELWRLEWEKPPLPACEAGDAMWITCPCAGFAFGERGLLDLVRLRDGKEVERLPLTPLFAEGIVDYGAVAILRRAEPSEADFKDELEDPGLAGRVRTRPSERVLDLADYEHDGQAREFLLQVAAAPCGKRMHVAVGVSRADPRLHVLHSLAYPERPLVLRIDHWQALRQAAAPPRRVDWPCGDHGSDTETELELRADQHGIAVHEREYLCTKAGERGRLLREKDR